MVSLHEERAHRSPAVLAVPFVLPEMQDIRCSSSALFRVLSLPPFICLFLLSFLFVLSSSSIASKAGRISLICITNYTTAQLPPLYSLNCERGRRHLILTLVSPNIQYRGFLVHITYDAPVYSLLKLPALELSQGLQTMSFLQTKQDGKHQKKHRTHPGAVFLVYEIRTEYCDLKLTCIDCLALCRQFCFFYFVGML